MENSKNPNIKEFIKYLDKTLEMFDDYIPEEDFERRDSDAYKLFTTLFRMYDEISQDKINYKKYNSGNISKIVSKHIENKRKKMKTNRPKWENDSVDSDIIAQRLHREGLRKMIETDDGPILSSSDLENKQIPRIQSKKIKNTTIKNKFPISIYGENSFFTNGNTDDEPSRFVPNTLGTHIYQDKHNEPHRINSLGTRNGSPEPYDKTDDIDTKLRKLKKRLSKH